MLELLKNAVGETLPEIVALRHELHQHPETRFEETWTSDRIARFLDEIGVAHQRGFAKGTGIVATIEGTSGKTVALRADMDALEIQEETGLPYASHFPKRMHACGHDGHMASLCGVAKVLVRRRDALRGTVRLIFQPAEEIAGGGRLMVEEGVLDGVDAVFAFHGWPSVPLGHVAVKSGELMAGARDFRIIVRGAGCHGADPGSGVDPILVAAHIITALQTIVSREINPWEAGVVTVACVHAGHTTNVIPDTAELRGTMRSLSAGRMKTIAESIERIAVATARAFRATVEIELGEGPYPPLRNDPAMTDFVRETVTEILGGDRLIELTAPTMAAEDFAFYLDRVPGSLMYIGVNPNPPARLSAPLHSPHFDFNDAALPTAMLVMAGLAVRFLERI